MKTATSFFQDTAGDYITGCHKRDDLKIRALNPQAGDWVNFSSEYGDVWHKVIRTYQPENYFSSIYCFDQVDVKSNKVKESSFYFYQIRKISKELPSNARVIFDASGAYSERRGNVKSYFQKGA